MIRDMEKFKQSLKKQHKWALDYFNTIKNKLLKKSADWLKKGYPNKAEVLLQEANKMKFQFDKREININYGRCTKFNKDVSFIPNTCQLETQNCFRHRLDMQTSSSAVRIPPTLQKSGL